MWLSRLSLYQYLVVYIMTQLHMHMKNVCHVYSLHPTCCSSQINAAMGCLARIPLPNRAFPAAPSRIPPRGGDASGLSPRQRLMSAKDRMMEAWAPYLK